MKTKIIISICLLLSSIAIQATGMLPQGRWEIMQIAIEKNTDGNVQTAVYKTAADVKSHILCPQEWEINAETIVMRYPNGWEETSPSYIVDGNQLIMQTTDGPIPPYQYNTNDGNLTLITIHNYVNNLPTGNTERISEKWIITLKKQS